MPWKMLVLGKKPMAGVVYNPLGWDRSDVQKMEIKPGEQYRVLDGSGQELLSQAAPTEEGGYALYFSPGRVPAMGWKTMFLKQGAKCVLKGPAVAENADKIEIDNGLVKIIKDADVVINCAGPFYKTAVAVARAAVEAKVNYIDICDDYEATDILFTSDIDQAAKEAGITVLTGMGSDPGTNNVIVKWYANQLDRVDEIALFWVVSIAELSGAAWDELEALRKKSQEPCDKHEGGECDCGKDKGASAKPQKTSLIKKCLTAKAQRAQRNLKNRA
jgi:hypothetical protein